MHVTCTERNLYVMKVNSLNEKFVLVMNVCMPASLNCAVSGTAVNSAMSGTVWWASAAHIHDKSEQQHPTLIISTNNDKD